ncbi:MAG: hypothetical protein Kow00120_29460 [Anaerolineae bacterium]
MPAKCYLCFLQKPTLDDCDDNMADCPVGVCIICHALTCACHGQWYPNFVCVRCEARQLGANAALLTPTDSDAREEMLAGIDVAVIGRFRNLDDYMKQRPGFGARFFAPLDDQERVRAAFHDPRVWADHALQDDLGAFRPDALLLLAAAALIVIRFDLYDQEPPYLQHITAALRGVLDEG